MYWDSYRVYDGFFYRDNGKEHGNYRDYDYDVTACTPDPTFFLAKGLGFRV